jgi:nitrite reductase (NADH) small subunit
MMSGWQPVCAVDRVPRDRGIAALVDGVQLALFHVPEDGCLFVIDNIDPFSGVGCLSRGIVGDTAGEAMVVSPLHKQRFSLRTGACLDDPTVCVAVYEARVREDMVEVLLP